MLLVDTFTCPIFVSLLPLFWISSEISSGFQSQSGFCLIRFCGGEYNVHSLRSISGATPANLLMVSIVGGNLRQWQNVVTYQDPQHYVSSQC